MNIKFTRNFTDIKGGNVVKYPNQVFSSVKEYKDGSKMTFAVDANFVATEDIDGCLPSSVHRAGLSRLVLTLLRKTASDITTVSGNIPIADYANLKKRIEFSQNVIRESEIGVNNVANDSPTSNNELSKFTTTFKFGKNAGKTAMDIVKENPSNYESILKQNIDFLQGVIDKNPNGPYAESNAKFIAEINELLEVLKTSNKIEPQSSKAINFVVYDSGIKVPNASKLNEHGKTMVYTIKISMNTGMNIPYNVEIMNCYANCPKAGNVDMKSMECKTLLSVRLTEAQLDELIDSIDVKKTRFEMLNAEHAAALEDKYSYYHTPIVKNFEIDESVISEILTKLTK